MYEDIALTGITDDNKETNFLSEYEKRGLKLYLKKDIKGLEKHLALLSREFNEEDYIFLTALYASLIKHKNAKYLLEKSLSLYDSLNYSEKTGVYLAYALKEFYKDRENLEKIYSFIFKIIHEITNVFFIEVEDCLNIAVEAGEWLKKNLYLNTEEIDFINFVLLKLMNKVAFYKLEDNEKKEFLRTYIRLLWEARSILKKENERIFSPIFKGVVNAYLKTLNSEERINFITGLGVEEYIARELTNTYIEIEWDGDDGDGVIDDEKIPF